MIVSSNSTPVTLEVLSRVDTGIGIFGVDEVGTSRFLAQVGERYSAKHANQVPTISNNVLSFEVDEFPDFMSDMIDRSSTSDDVYCIGYGAGTGEVGQSVIYKGEVIRSQSGSEDTLGLSQLDICVPYREEWTEHRAVNSLWDSWLEQTQTSVVALSGVPLPAPTLPAPFATTPDEDPESFDQTFLRACGIVWGRE